MSTNRANTFDPREISNTHSRPRECPGKERVVVRNAAFPKLLNHVCVKEAGAPYAPQDSEGCARRSMHKDPFTSCLTPPVNVNASVYFAPPWRSK